ncbi:MAG: DUF1186 family protein [Chloroflexi bacterium]|nr:DUF1186 family protein [Chloroflexota bacterium]
MIKHNYTEPVSKLLTLGRPNDSQGWLDYLKMGITGEDIPELICLLEDKDLRWMERPADLPEGGDLTEWYGQIHAWRALAQLKAEEAIPALLNNLQEIDEYNDDWYGEDAFEVFPMIGPAAVHPLAEYLADSRHGTWARVAASASLEKMAEAHPEVREACAEAIVHALRMYKANNEALNGCMISDLEEMGAALEHLDLIEEAFKSGNVDEEVDGDFEDLQIRLGLKHERSKPRQHSSLFDESPMPFNNNLPDIKKLAKKEKNKRKQEKKSRKRNRKKK